MAHSQRSGPPSPNHPRVEDARFRSLVESLSDYAVVLLDRDGCIASWNPGAEQIQGYSADEIIGEHFSTFYTPEALAVGHPESELSIARATGRYSEEGWRIRKDGRRFWAHVVIIALYDAEGQHEGYGKVMRDLTELKQAEEQAANTLALLRTTARTDPLTGALNRRALDEALTSQLRLGRQFCIAMLDIDNFKRYNDERGHACGDRLLRHTVGAWSLSLREGDLLARYGGDEFVVVLPDCTLAQGSDAIERVLSGTPEDCRCSFGLAAWTPGVGADELLGQADAALYERKAIRYDDAVAAGDLTSTPPRMPSILPRPPFSNQTGEDHPQQAATVASSREATDTGAPSEPAGRFAGLGQLDSVA